MLFKKFNVMRERGGEEKNMMMKKRKRFYINQCLYKKSRTQMIMK